MINRSITNLRFVLATVLVVSSALVGAAAAQVRTGGGDPFARFNARLNDAASRTLGRVVQPDPAGKIDEGSRAQESQPSPPSVAQGATQRIERLRPALEPILHEIGVPVEFAAVVLVESGGQPAALSPKGARGLWQLMPDTARRYGLVVDDTRDDRLDVLRSTRAAGQYLRDLYAQFHDWQLALAAYNAGEQTVQRAMTRTGGTVFSIASRALPVETQNYVPAVLNALERYSPRTSLPFTNYTRLQRVVYAGAAQ